MLVRLPQTVSQRRLVRAEGRQVQVAVPQVQPVRLALAVLMPFVLVRVLLWVVQVQLAVRELVPLVSAPQAARLQLAQGQVPGWQPEQVRSAQVLCLVCEVEWSIVHPVAQHTNASAVPSDQASTIHWLSVCPHKGSNTRLSRWRSRHHELRPN